MTFNLTFQLRPFLKWRLGIHFFVAEPLVPFRVVRVLPSPCRGGAPQDAGSGCSWLPMHVVPTIAAASYLHHSTSQYHSCYYCCCCSSLKQKDFCPKTYTMLLLWYRYRTQKRKNCLWLGMPPFHKILDHDIFKSNFCLFVCISSRPQCSDSHNQ